MKSEEDSMIRVYSLRNDALNADKAVIRILSNQTMMAVRVRRAGGKEGF
jgi:hypothetical protein